MAFTLSATPEALEAERKRLSAPQMNIPISSQDLTQQGTPQFPPTPVDNTNYNAPIAAGTAQIGAGMSFFQTPEQIAASKTGGITTADSELATALKNIETAIGARPQSQEALYAAALESSKIEAAQQEQARTKAVVRASQAKLAGIQAQVQAVVDKRDVQNLKLEGQAAGGQVVGTILNRQQAEVNRQAAIEALPLQALALAAQAEVASLQGEAEYAQSALAMAQEKLNTVFKIKSEDADRQYNYWKDLRDKFFDFATEAQKNKLAAQQKEDDRKHELYKDERNDNQAKATALISSGQAELAAKFSQLDPKSATYQQDKANLLGQIKSKELTGQSDFEQAFFRDKGRLPTVQELLDYKAKEAAAGRKPEKVSGVEPSRAADQLTFLRNTAADALKLSSASGRSGARKTFESWFVGSTNYTKLESLTNTLRTNVLSLMTDPDIKKFFGPQMSDADVRLMTAAGTTLNPELQGPGEIKKELNRLDNLLNRMQTAVRLGKQGTSNIITAPDGTQIEIID